MDFKADEELDSKTDDLFHRRTTRRKALSTMGKVGVGAAAVIVAGAAYYAGTATAPAATPTTVTKTQTVTSTVTTTTTPTTVVTSPTTTTGPQVTMNIFTMSGPRFQWALEATAEEYVKLHPNVTIKFDYADFPDNMTKQAAEMAAKSSRYSIMEVAYQYVGNYAKSAWALKLNKYVEQDPNWWKDYLSDVPQQGAYLYNVDTDIRGPPEGDATDIWCLSHDANVVQMFYRTDVWAADGFKTPEDMDKFTTTTLFDELKKLHKPPDMYGATVHAEWSQALDGFFGSVLYGMGGKWWEPGVWNPDGYVNGPTAQRTVDTMMELMNYCPPQAIEAREFDVADMMGNVGTVATAPFEYGNSAFTSKATSKLYDKITSTYVPMDPVTGGRAPVMGGWGLCINPYASPAMQDLAWDFIKFTCSRENMSGVYVKGTGKAQSGTGQAARQSALRDPSNLAVYPYYAGLAKNLAISHWDPGIPEWFDILGAGGRVVQDILTKKVDKVDGLNKISAAIKDVFSKSGRKIG